MVKKQLDKEDKVLGKIDNKYEFIGYILRYRLKEALAVLAMILFGIVIWLWLTRVSPEDVEKKVKEKVKAITKEVIK